MLFNLEALDDELIKIRIQWSAIWLVFGQHFIRPPNNRRCDHGQVPRHVQKMRQKRYSLPDQQRHVCTSEPEGFNRLGSFLSVQVRSIRRAGGGEVIWGGGGDDQNVVDHRLTVVEQEVPNTVHELLFLRRLLDDASHESEDHQEREIGRSRRCRNVSVGSMGRVCVRTTHRIEIGRALKDLRNQCQTSLYWRLRKA